MINRFKSNIESFIFKRKKIHNNYTRTASILGHWDDIAWGVSPERFRFCKFASNRYVSEKNISQYSHIPEYYQNFCKAYLSYLSIEHGLPNSRLLRELTALKCLIKILENKKFEIFQINKIVLNEVFSLIKNTYNGRSLETYGASICNQIKFLTSNKMLNIPLNTTNPFKYNHSCTDVIIKKRKMLPNNDVLLATADIYRKTMPKDIHNFSIFENVNARTACSIASILFAAPSRIGELVLLSRNKEINNKKFKYLNEISDINGTSYSLIWRGSKKMIDHEKHVISSMAPIVNDSLSYLNKVGEPARILCKFYENPQIKLKDLLPLDFQNNLLNLNKTTHLFQLGGILGFYSMNNLRDLNNSWAEGCNGLINSETFIAS